MKGRELLVESSASRKLSWRGVEAVGRGNCARWRRGDIELTGEMPLASILAINEARKEGRWRSPSARPKPARVDARSTGAETLTAPTTAGCGECRDISESHFPATESRERDMRIGRGQRRTTAARSSSRHYDRSGADDDFSMQPRNSRRAHPSSWREPQPSCERSVASKSPRARASGLPRGVPYATSRDRENRHLPVPAARDERHAHARASRGWFARAHGARRIESESQRVCGPPYPSLPLRQTSPRSPPARIDAQYTPNSARNEGNHSLKFSTRGSRRSRRH